MAMTKAQYFDQGMYDAGGCMLNGNLYGSESWQGKAYTEGHRAGKAARAATMPVQSIAPTGEMLEGYKMWAPIHDVQFQTLQAPDIVAKVTAAVQRRVDRVAAMTKGYLTALAWSTGDTHPQTGEELEDLEDFEFSTEAREAALKVCARFYDENTADLGAYADLRIGDVGTSHVSRQLVAYEYAGHDLWLNSQGHGVGFWDRGMGNLGERLSKASKAFEAVYPCLGDDLQIHITGNACN